MSPRAEAQIEQLFMKLLMQAEQQNNLLRELTGVVKGLAADFEAGTLDRIAERSAEQSLALQQILEETRKQNVPQPLPPPARFQDGGKRR